MHVDAVAFVISCIGKVDIAQIVAKHGDVAFIAMLAFTGKFEAKLAFETAAAGGGSGKTHARQSDGLVKKLQLPVLACSASMGDGQFMGTGSCPPHGRQSHRDGQNQQI